MKTELHLSCNISPDDENQHRLVNSETEEKYVLEFGEIIIEMIGTTMTVRQFPQRGSTTRYR